MTDIHSCSYYCDQPECIKAQRDELRDKLAQPEQEDGCPVCGSDVHDRDALDKAEREIERLSALVKPAPVQEKCRVCGEDEATLMVIRECNKCGSEYAGKAEFDLAKAQHTWVGLTKEDMPDGENPMFDHEYFIAGMVFAAKILEEKNT